MDYGLMRNGDDPRVVASIVEEGPPADACKMSPNPMRYLNLFTLCAVNFMWAAQYPAYKVASDHMDVTNLSFWTFVFATILLLPFLLREQRQVMGAGRLDRSAVSEFILLGLAGCIPPSVFIAWGISHSTASNAAIISLTIPVLMVLMAVAMLGEHMTGLRWCSIGMAVIGTVLVSRIKSGSGFFSGSVVTGNLVIFLAGAGSAFYNTYSKKLLARFSELQVLVYSYLVAGVACAALSLLGGGRPFYRIAGYPLAAWGAVLVLGAVSWGLAMGLWMWVLKRLEVSQVSASIYLLPVFGVILSAATLHERLTLYQLGGGLLVFLGTFLTSDYESRLARKKLVEEK
jgi:drug/metabolite transporter (DMT)-like permease